MRIAWTVGGALFGRVLFGKLGMVLGGALGYAMAPEEGRTGARSSLREPVGEASGVGAAPAEPAREPGAQERYPEETVIDAVKAEEESEAPTPEEEVGTPGAGRSS